MVWIMNGGHMGIWAYAGAWDIEVQLTFSFPLLSSGMAKGEQSRQAYGMRTGGEGTHARLGQGMRVQQAFLCCFHSFFFFFFFLYM
jgi:hypothetical protein